jgi:hypothetical protein
MEVRRTHLAARQIKLADLATERSTVEMFEHTYTVRPITRSVQKKLEGLNEALQALADEEDSDKVVATLADGLDVLLDPVDGAPAPKGVIVKQWKADALSLSQLHGLFEGVQEAAVERPT